MTEKPTNVIKDIVSTIDCGNAFRILEKHGDVVITHRILPGSIKTTVNIASESENRTTIHAGSYLQTVTSTLHKRNIKLMQVIWFEQGQVADIVNTQLLMCLQTG